MPELPEHPTFKDRRDLMLGRDRDSHPVGLGWMPLVLELDEALAKLDPDYYLAQVKEKFGGLRYYADPHNELSEEDHKEFHRLIDEAEAKSYKICERCGKDGVSRNDLGWIKVLCETCYDQETLPEGKMIPIT